VPAAAFTADSGESDRHSFITASTRPNRANAASRAAEAREGSAPRTVIVAREPPKGLDSEIEPATLSLALDPAGHNSPAAMTIAASHEEIAVKGSPKIIDILNEVLTNELTAINQYFLHARMCENWGYERLWKKIRAESIDEMKHADKVIERVLYLEGFPNIQRLGKITIGENVEEQLRLDLALEGRAIPFLNQSIPVCRAEGDAGTAELLEHILVEEEEHANWLEAQLTLVEQVGLQNYLSEQIKDE
jgi:bacterioferritin